MYRLIRSEVINEWMNALHERHVFVIQVVCTFSLAMQASHLRLQQRWQLQRICNTRRACAGQRWRSNCGRHFMLVVPLSIMGSTDMHGFKATRMHIGRHLVCAAISRLVHCYHDCACSYKVGGTAASNLIQSCQQAPLAWMQNVIVAYLVNNMNNLRRMHKLPGQNNCKIFCSVRPKQIELINKTRKAWYNTFC